MDRLNIEVENKYFSYDFSLGNRNDLLNIDVEGLRKEIRENGKKIEESLEELKNLNKSING